MMMTMVYLKNTKTVEQLTTSISFGKDYMSGAMNGTSLGTDSTVYYESEWNVLYLGGTGTSNERLNGYLSHFTVYPEALTLAQLIDLSEE